MAAFNLHQHPCYVHHNWDWDFEPTSPWPACSPILVRLTAGPEPLARPLTGLFWISKANEGKETTVISQGYHNKIPQTGDLQQQTFTLSQFRRFWKSEIKMSAGPCPPWGSKGSPSLALPRFWWLLEILGVAVKIYRSSLCLHPHMVFSSCVCIVTSRPLCVSLCPDPLVEGYQSWIGTH